jgi:hypothetical protein
LKLAGETRMTLTIQVPPDIEADLVRYDIEALHPSVLILTVPGIK